MWNIIIWVLGSLSVLSGGAYIADKLAMVDLGLSDKSWSLSKNKNIDERKSTNSLNNKNSSQGDINFLNYVKNEKLQRKITLAQKKLVASFQKNIFLKNQLKNKLAENFTCLNENKDFQKTLDTLKNKIPQPKKTSLKKIGNENEIKKVERKTLLKREKITKEPSIEKKSPTETPEEKPKSLF